MSDNNTSITDINNDTAGRFMRWVSIISAVLTIFIAVLGAISSFKMNDIKTETENLNYKIAEQTRELDRGRFSLDVSKSNLERYTFVEKQINKALSQDELQNTLTVNLINLVLTPEEGSQLFYGLEVSKDEKLRLIGILGNKIANRKIIFLHLGKHDGSGSEPLVPIQNALSEIEGFLIAGSDDLIDKYGPGVDYFYEEDKLGAEKVVDILNKLRKQDEKPFVARPQLSKKIQKKGTLGIWF